MTGTKKTKLLTPEEVRARLDLKNVKTLALWRSTKRYNLPYIKVGRNVRYLEDDVEEFLRLRKNGGSSN